MNPNFNYPSPGLPGTPPNLPFSYPQDAGNSCANPNPGGSGGGGYCSQGPFGPLPAPGPVVGNNGMIILNGVGTVPPCFSN